MTDQADTPTKFQPPYMSWTTFEGILDQFTQTGIPDQIDRSVLATRSGGDQSQFLRAAMSFGLIDEQGTPTQRMHSLVRELDRRGELLSEILNESYGNVIALGTGATQQQLEAEFRTFGIEGETIRKAIAFYINAAKQAEIPLSVHFKSTRPGAGGRTRARRSPRATKGAAGSNGDTPQSPSPSGRTDLPEIVGALVAKLPKKGETWTSDEAKWWLDMAEMAFPREYGYDAPAQGT